MSGPTAKHHSRSEQNFGAARIGPQFHILPDFGKFARLLFHGTASEEYFAFGEIDQTSTNRHNGLTVGSDGGQGRQEQSAYRHESIVSLMWRVFALSAVIAFAQEPVTLRSDTTLVLIPVAVTDKLNRFVVGLSKSNFKLYEDGKEQKITDFSGEDAPLSVGILVDTSGSMDMKLSRSRAAAREFLKTMNQEDEGFLIEFNDSVEMMHGFHESVQGA